MKDIIMETLVDGIKLLPFLFLAFLLMEYIEHKVSDKSKEIVRKSGKLGPLFGSLLGAFPQCGFSVAATNLYAGRIVTVGTLISIYLSTSDEMLPILIASKADPSIIIKIIIFKVIIGMTFGFIIDFLLRKKEINKETIHDFCHSEHCDCEHSIFKSSIKHTFNIFVFIIVTSFLLNLSLNYLDENLISKIFMKGSFFSFFISSLIGLIPNCGASVIITELYINDIITLGSALSGLLTGTGVAILVLFKVNKNRKENIKILLTIYIIGIFSGLMIDLLSILF